MSFTSIVASTVRRRHERQDLEISSSTRQCDRHERPSPPYASGISGSRTFKSGFAPGDSLWIEPMTSFSSTPASPGHRSECLLPGRRARAVPCNARLRSCPSASAGSSMMKVEPAPRALSTWTAPPWASTIARTM
jgi:hypothetical protein